jgi:hypothetical protein
MVPNTGFLLLVDDIEQHDGVGAVLDGYELVSAAS